MSQPINKNRVKNKKYLVPKKGSTSKKYGTSKLEEKFAKNFLDKLGLEYDYQYEAKSIGRFFDFRIKNRGPIIEVNGSYWHGDPLIYEEKDLNRVQKRAKYVDEVKKKWCEKNGIKIIYVWEIDINKHPEKVLELLKQELSKYIKNEKRINH